MLHKLRDHSSVGGAYLSGAGPVLAAFLPESQHGVDVADESIAALANAGTSSTAQIIEVQHDGLRAEIA